MLMQTPNKTRKHAAGKTGQRGWSLIETLVATAIGTFVAGSIVTTGVTLSDTMVAIGNYCDLNRASRTTLDTMSADLRNTASVTQVSSSSVTVSNFLTGEVIGYTWDGSNCVTRTFNGGSQVMLKNCDYFSIANFQRNPTNNFQFVPASSAATTKLISVSWHCSRQILGAKLNTESVQTAQICIRN